MERIKKIKKNLDEKRLIWLFVATGTALLNYYIFYWLADILGSRNPKFIAFLLVSAVVVHELCHFIAFETNKIHARMYFLVLMGGTSELKAFKEKLKNLSLERQSTIMLSGVFGNFLVIGVSYFLLQKSIVTFNDFLAILNLNGVLILYNLIPLWIFDGGFFAKMLFDSINDKRRDTDYEIALLGGFVGILIIIMVITGNLDIISFLLLPFAIHIRAKMTINFRLIPFDLHIRSRVDEPRGPKDPKSIPMSRQKWWAALYMILILVASIIVANTKSWIFLVK